MVGIVIETSTRVLFVKALGLSLDINARNNSARLHSESQFKMFYYSASPLACDPISRDFATELENRVA